MGLFYVRLTETKRAYHLGKIHGAMLSYNTGMTTERAYRMTTQVGPGKRIELVAPELVEGEQVEVFVVPQGREDARRGSFLDLIDSFPPGPRSAATWEEVKAGLQAERDAWDR